MHVPGKPLRVTLFLEETVQTQKNCLVQYGFLGPGFLGPGLEKSLFV
jgi:hypothetical protein